MDVGVTGRVYVETSVLGYLTARPSRDLLVAAHQQITSDWWAAGRQVFDCYISQAVLEEAAGGDPEAAKRRLAVVRDMPLLSVTDDAMRLADDLVAAGAIPAEAAEDALHIALAAVHGMDYLLTWNCRHIANATMRNRIADVCADHGYVPPVICTPEELPND